MSNGGRITESKAIDIAWSYFDLHAKQRISLFNYFVIFSAFLTTGMITTFDPKFAAHLVGAVAGAFQTTIAFLFWKIDERNKYLTKHGENALKELEDRLDFVQDSPAEPSCIRLFTSEKILTNQLRAAQKGKGLFSRQISHSKSFNALFVVFGIAGLLGMGFSISCYVQYDDRDVILKDSGCLIVPEVAGGAQYFLNPGDVHLYTCDSLGYLNLQSYGDSVCTVPTSVSNADTGK